MGDSVETITMAINKVGKDMVSPVEGLIKENVHMVQPVSLIIIVPINHVVSLDMVITIAERE